MVNTARDEFLRRYATSPIHVPRLERLLAVYGSGEENDPFCSRFITWDRECPDGEAARIVTEIISAGDAAGRITKHSEDVIRGAIRWMSDPTSLPVAERARDEVPALGVREERGIECDDDRERDEHRGRQAHPALPGDARDRIDVERPTISPKDLLTTLCPMNSSYPADFQASTPPLITAMSE